jgi:hypothetical protein
MHNAALAAMKAASICGDHSSAVFLPPTRAEVNGRRSCAAAGINLL